MRWKRGSTVVLSIGGLALAVGVLTWSMGGVVFGGPSPGAGPAAVEAPDVEFQAVQGTTESLADYRGKVVVFNIWGTWCPPCIREIPHLVEVQRDIEPRGGTVIGLAVESGSSEDVLAFWADRLELDPAYPLWLGTNREARHHFDAYGLPNTLIIDQDGLIRERFLGLVTQEVLLERIEPYLR